MPDQYAILEAYTTISLTIIIFRRIDNCFGNTSNLLKIVNTNN